MDRPQTEMDLTKINGEEPTSRVELGVSLGKTGFSASWKAQMPSLPMIMGVALFVAMVTIVVVVYVVATQPTAASPGLLGLAGSVVLAALVIIVIALYFTMHQTKHQPRANPTRPKANAASAPRGKSRGSAGRARKGR